MIGLGVLFLSSLEAYSPVNRTGITSGLFTKSILAEVENSTKYAHFTNVKHIYKHNPKVSPLSTQQTATTGQSVPSRTLHVQTYT